MRNTFKAIVFILLTGNQVHSQNLQDAIIGTRTWTSPVRLTGCPSLKTPIGSNFEVIKSNNGGKTWQIYLYDSALTIIAECETDYLNIVQHSKPNGKASLGLTVGLKSDLMIIRPPRSPSEFVVSPNLGITFGVKFPHRLWRNTTYSILTSYGIRSVTLDSVNVNRNANLLSTNNSFIALSVSVGFAIEYRKLQVGAFLGVDRISAKVNQNFDWHHQGKLWYGIGIGYELFSTGSNKTK